MTLKEIRESGLLELYLIGSLDGSERSVVEKALVDYPELSEDLERIGGTLQGYAAAHSVEPSAQLKTRLMDQISETKSTTSAETSGTRKGSSANLSQLWPGLAALLAIVCGVLGYLLNQAKNESNQIQTIHNNLEQTCDSLRQRNEIQFATLENLTNPNNLVIPVTPTEKYSSTDLYFHHNEVNRKNYVQIRNLPEIDNSTQSFQLWSLKGSDPPIPLDVFQSDGSNLIEVAFVDATNVYAITIEPRGGSQSPTLDDLIGTFGIA